MSYPFHQHIRDNLTKANLEKLVELQKFVDKWYNNSLVGWWRTLNSLLRTRTHQQTIESGIEMRQAIRNCLYHLDKEYNTVSKEEQDDILDTIIVDSEDNTELGVDSIITTALQQLEGVQRNIAEYGKIYLYTPVEELEGLVPVLSDCLTQLELYQTELSNITGSKN